MRIAYLSTDPGIAFGGTKGAAIHVLEVVRAMETEGSEVLVLMAAIAPDAPLSPGIQVETLPEGGRDSAGRERVRYDDGLALWLEARLRRFRPEAIYERLALNSAAGAAVARRLGVPHLLEVNAPLPEEAARYRGLADLAGAARLERAVIAGSDLVFAVSPPLADYAVSRGARRVAVLQNAASLERFGPPVRSGGSPVAVFAGTIRPWHGMDTIAAAWRRLGTAAPRLLVIGDGPDRRLLDGIDAQVTGRVAPADVPPLLAGADIGLAPYGADAPDYFSPIKLFEYLAAGLATVVADLPAATAVVDDNTAVVIPKGDPHALARAVASLSTNPAERRRLGLNGQALIATGHTWRHRARSILEAAGELATAGRSSA